MPRTITVVGAGIFGLWQALLLARAGHRVRLIERSTEPFKGGASQWAGAMIALYVSVFSLISLLFAYIDKIGSI